MKRKNDEFTPIGSLVSRFLKELEEARSENSAELEALWRKTVGPALAEVSRVCGVKAETVMVETQSSAVLSELRQFYRDSFLRKLREEGMRNVRNVSFRLADGWDVESE